ERSHALAECEELVDYFVYGPCDQHLLDEIIVSEPASEHRRMLLEERVAAAGFRLALQVAEVVRKRISRRLRHPPDGRIVVGDEDALRDAPVFALRLASGARATFDILRPVGLDDPPVSGM